MLLSELPIHIQALWIIRALLSLIVVYPIKMGFLAICYLGVNIKLWLISGYYAGKYPQLKDIK